MKQEELRDIPLGYDWTHHDLRNSFADVWGGVAFPGKQPGFAVVAGLCQPMETGNCEVHVLDEVESVNLYDLLRQCRGLAQKYRLAFRPAAEPFRWIGDSRHTGASQIIYELNQEGERNQRDRPASIVIYPTSILDMPQPYSYMLAELRVCMEKEPKQLYLHGSRTEHWLTGILPEDVPHLQFGDYPSAEALAYVTVALREHGIRVLEDIQNPPKEYTPYNPMDYV